MACLLLFAVHTAACTPIQAHATEPGRQVKRVDDKSIFLPAREVLSVPLAEPSLGLVYETSDVGPSVDLVPKPVTFSRSKGLYLIDPGPSHAPAPSLQRFGLDGKRTLHVQLASQLKLPEPALFKAHALLIDPTGRIFIVFSAGYDAELGHEKDFAVASLDSAGRLISVVPLHTLKPPYPVYRSALGELWTYTNEKQGGRWSIFDPQGIRKQRVEAMPTASLMPDGRLLALTGTGGASLYEATGRRSAVTAVRSYYSGSFSVVAGAGRFFGLVWSPVEDREQVWSPTDERENRGRGRTEDKQVLQLLYFDTPSNSLHVVGDARVASEIYEYRAAEGVETAEHFEISELSSMSFDEEGNLYLITRRGPKKPSLTVYRMELRKDVRDSIIGTSK
jgi:hypothetical protein